MMINLKAVIITGLMIAGFMAISFLAFLIWPLIMVAIIYFIVLTIIKNKPPREFLGGFHI